MVWLPVYLLSDNLTELNNVTIEIERDNAVKNMRITEKKIVTSLTNKAMPLIRYQTGDWGSLRPSDSSCNKNDIIVINKGRVVKYSIIYFILKSVKGVRT